MIDSDGSQTNREVSELESLVESKIYREDELETQVAELKLEVRRLRSHPDLDSLSARPSESSHSRESSTHTTGGNGCELCDGPHELNACPIFSGNTLGGSDGKPELVLGHGKAGKFCADCEVSANGTVTNGEVEH